MSKILVIEDSPTQAAEISFILESAGFDVETRDTAEAGAQQITGDAFDLILTDLVLPGMSGIDLCRQVKADPQTRDLPVVVITASGDATDVLRGLEAGADGYLSKGRDPDDIVDRIKRILQQPDSPMASDDEGPVTVSALGHKFRVTASRQQLLNVLVSSFEDLARMNLALAEHEKELQRSNEELESFAHIVSHDLKEPLRTVSTFCQFLAEKYKEQLDEEAEEWLDYIVDGTARMKQLIDDLLVYARAGDGERSLEPVNLNDVADQVVTSLQTAIDECNATVQVEDLPTVTADPLMMQQLLQNLVSNAIKYRQESPPHVQLAAAREGEAWKFLVRDNGIGVPEKYLEKIFAAFKRLHGRSKFAGTGVGLAICKRIVELHGGRIWAESAPGEGSRFYFTLPMSSPDV